MQKDFEIKDRYDMDDLMALMVRLRSENGCPWDREQTHQSIRKNLIEETYEVVEAIDKDDMDLMREELGDLLLQIAFHTQMETEAGHFTLEDVITELCQKLVIRHPHVFGDVTANDSGTVLKNWDAIKRQTKDQTTVLSTLESVPANLPALMRAQKVQHRAARAGMDFANAKDALTRLKEEVNELETAMNQPDNREIVAEELGDLFFSCCNVARLCKLDGEECLTKATDKFTDRTGKIEAMAACEGKMMEQLSSAQLDELWQAVKSASRT